MTPARTTGGGTTIELVTDAATAGATGPAGPDLPSSGQVTTTPSMTPSPVAATAIIADGPLARSMIDALRDMYGFHGEPVATRLAEKPHLIPLLARATIVICRVFGDVRPSLSTDIDGGLVARIPCSDDVPHALARLDEFDRAWWNGALRAARGELVFDVE